MSRYFRPITGEQGLPLAGGPCRFDRVEVLARGAPPAIIPAADVPDAVVARLTAPRHTPGLVLPADRPAVMAVLNLTPDSFSDGGRLGADAVAVLAAEGADIIDIGAESTRPGAEAVPVAEELARLAPILAAPPALPWSIDTRKAPVMAAALAAGAALVNDVSALTHGPAALALLAGHSCPIVLMHHQGTPATMQQAPHYDDVLLDVFDWLAGRIAACEAAGIARNRLIVDPGIGFGKTLAHNLALLRGLALLHGLGVPILLGASRKSLISRLSGDAPPEERLPGSLALALHGMAQGVQLLRVHDVAATRQAIAVAAALRG